MAEALTQAGRYLIVGELGRGSMGVVYKGFDPIIGRTVAIKTMLPANVTPEEFKEYKARFQREAQAAGVLAHPNIITVYDFGEDNGVLYLAMEFLEGKSLDSIMQERTVLPIETILPIYDQVCSALDHAHLNNIVHRDVKPANIMILNNGLVKMTDFGIAKMMSMGMTQVGQVLGTPNYMSPEQIKGRQIDGRSDIFALGVILYELATGEKPFAGQNITTVIYKIINENPTPPRELDASISPGLSYVISKALAKNVEERYQTCRELAEDLRNYQRLGGATVGQETANLIASPLPVIGTEPAAPSVVPDEGKREEGKEEIGVIPISATPPVAAGPVQAEPHPPGPHEWVPAPPTPAPAPPAPPGAIGETPLASGRGVPAVPAAVPHAPGIPMVAWISGGLLLLLIAVIVGYFAMRPKPQQPTPTTAETPTAPASAAAPPVPTFSVPSTTVTGTAGQLMVSSNVTGARIAVDNRTDPSWLTPYTIPSLAAGPHTVTITAVGYGEYRQNVTVEGGRTTRVEGRLSPAEKTSVAAPEEKPIGQGQLTVSSNVPGARITIDDRSEPGWVTPRTISGISAGAHNVMVSMDGYDSYQQSVTVASGQTVGVEANLSAPKAELDIITVPRGIEVIIDGKSYGPSPVSALLPIGNHTYAVKPPGGEAQETIYKLTGGIHRITVTLGEAEATGIVIVRTTPPGAIVLADGARISGQTPTSCRLNVGTHTIFVSLSGYQPQQQQVTVTENGTSSANFQLTAQ